MSDESTKRASSRRITPVIAARIVVAVVVLALTAGPIGFFLTPMGWFLIGKVGQENSQLFEDLRALGRFLLEVAIQSFHFTFVAAISQAILSEIAIWRGINRPEAMAMIGAVIGMAVGVYVTGKINVGLFIFPLLMGALMGFIYWLIAVRPRVRQAAVE